MRNKRNKTTKAPNVSTRRRPPSNDVEWDRVIEGPLAFIRCEVSRGLAQINELAPLAPPTRKTKLEAVKCKLIAIDTTLKGGSDA